MLNFNYISRTHEETSWIVFATIKKILKKTFFRLMYCVCVVCTNINKYIADYIRNLIRAICYSMIIFKMCRNV